MKIIIPVKVLKAHNVIKGQRETNLALNGIFISRESIISSDGRLILVSDNQLNPQMRTDYLVKIDHIPPGVQTAVLDTDLQVCYFLNQLVSQGTLKDLDLTNSFVQLTGARILKYPYPDVKPLLVMKYGKLSSLKVSAHVLNKITAVTKAICSRTGEVDLHFQDDKKGMVNALIRQGATIMNLYFKPMA